MPGPVFLEGDRLTLRLVEPDDYEFISSLWSNPMVRKQDGTLRRPFHESDIETFVEQDDTYSFLACQDQQPVGNVMIYDVDLEASNAELAYVVDPDEAGNGYATEAADLCLTHAFDGLGIHKVYARSRAGNNASHRVLEKLGFQQEGVFRSHYFSFGDYKDEHRFGLLASEWQAERS